MKTFLNIVIILIFVGSAVTSLFGQWQYTNGSANINNTNTGNVGIGTGTTTPAYKLHVVGNGIQASSSMNTNAKHLRMRATSSNCYLEASNAPLYISSNTSNTYLQPNGGFVGIGTTQPHAPLQLKNGANSRKIVLHEFADNNHQFTGFGIDNLSNFNAGALRYQIGSTTGAHVFYSATSTTSSKELLRIQGGGNVGIGTSTPSYKLDVNGNIRCSDITTSSDERFKTNIRTIENASDKIMALRGVNYLFRTEEFKEKYLPDNLQYGFIAQEMNQVLPELISQDHEGYYSVNYQGVIPIMVEAIKEQQLQIEEKETAINTIEESIADIKSRIIMLEQLVNKQAEAKQGQSIEYWRTNEFHVQPNPSTGDFFITLDSIHFNTSALVILVDRNGRKILSKSIEHGASIVEINIGDQLPGAYTFQIVSDGNVIQTGQLVLIKE